MQQMFHAHNIKRTILKQKHNTANSYHNNNLSITSDPDKQASLNKNQTTNLLTFSLYITLLLWNIKVCNL